MKNNIMVLIACLFLSVSCSQKTSVKDKAQLAVESDITKEVVDSSRLVVVNNPLELALDPSGSNLVFESNLLDFEHSATINAPTVSSSDLRKLRATSSIKLDNRLYITYMMEGSDFVGALDIVDISSTPTLLSTYRFNNIKLTDLKAKGSYLYLIGGKKNQGATMIVMNIANPVAPQFIKYYVFPGDIATSLDIRQAQILVSTANNGGYAYFNNEDAPNPKYIGFEHIDNATFVKGMLASDNSSELAPMVLGGSDSTKLMYKGEELVLSPIASEAPARFITMGPMVYVASAAGLSVTEISNGFHGFLRNLYLPGKVNGLSMLDQKLYVASGSEGLRLVSVDEPGNPQEVGFFKFDDVGNANNVWVERLNSYQKLIVLADGQKGVRLIKETRTLSSDSVTVTIHAKSVANAGQNGKLQVTINNQPVGDVIDVSSLNFETYTVSLPSPAVLHAGDAVNVLFTNDDGPRSISIVYVKIGEDYFYPWVNNYYFYSNTLVNNNDSDNIKMEEGGFYQFIF